MMTVHLQIFPNNIPNMIVSLSPFTRHRPTAAISSAAMHASWLQAIVLAWLLALPAFCAEDTVARTRPAGFAASAPKVVRFAENPVIRPEMLPGEDGANICGPSVIRVPDWLEKPLGKYYMYFADHKGGYIRLTYANRVEGPWTVYAPGTLKLDQMVAVAKAATTAAGGNAATIKGGHIASPDVHVDDEKKEIRMYFHFQIAPSDAWGHRSGVALSKDGIRFQPVNTKPIGEPYFRVFKWGGDYYAVGRSAALARSHEGLDEFEVGNRHFAAAVGHKILGRKPEPEILRTVAGGKDKEEGAIGQIRHTAMKLDRNVLTVFFSRAGDLPETLMSSTVELKGDWKEWRLSAPVMVLRPEKEYEGAGAPPKAPSNPEMRKLPRPMFNDLRDPCIFRDNGKTYLFYSVAGERGIAGAEILD